MKKKPGQKLVVTEELRGSLTALLALALAVIMSFNFWPEAPWTSGVWSGMALVFMVMAVVRLGNHRAILEQRAKRQQRQRKRRK